MESRIDQLLTDPDLRRTIAERARQLIDEHYNINIYMQRIIDALSYASHSRTRDRDAAG